MEKDYLILKRASASCPSGEWNDDDYDVLAESVGFSRAVPHLSERPGCGRSPSGSTKIETPTHGYAATREGAMATFAKSWRRE